MTSNNGDGLSKKHREFVNNYFLHNLNATDAYEASYPKATREAARRLGSRLLTRVDISKEINTRLQENAMSANEVLSRLADQAKGDIGQFTEVNDSNDLAKHPLSRIIKKYKKRRYTPRDENQDPYEEIEIELYDAHASLVDLGKVHALFTDKVEQSVEVTGKLVILPKQDG